MIARIASHPFTKFDSIPIFNDIGSMMIRYLKTKILAFLFVIVVLSGCVTTSKFLDESGGVSPESVAAFEEVTLNGVKQRILIRGRNAANPLLLILAGGPGGTTMIYAYNYLSELENHFTVVHWDQRGAGKSFSGSTHQR